MKHWSTIVAFWLLPWLELLAIYDSPVHIVGEKLSAKDVVAQVENRLDVRIFIEAQDRYAFRKDYDEWTTLNQLFPALIRYYRTYNDIELTLEGNKRRRYFLVPAFKKMGKMKSQLSADANTPEGSVEKTASIHQLEPLELEVSSGVGSMSPERSSSSISYSEDTGAEMQRAKESGSDGASASSYRLGEREFPSLFADKGDGHLAYSPGQSVQRSPLSVEVMGFKMALPEVLGEEEEVEDADTYLERSLSHKLYFERGVGAPVRPLLSIIPSVPDLGRPRPKADHIEVTGVFRHASEDRSSDRGYSKINSNAIGVRGAMRLTQQVWLETGIEAESLDWDLRFMAKGIDRNRTWLKGVDFSLHYDFPMSFPESEVRMSLTSRLPALWENDPWMPHQIQGGLHFGVKTSAGDSRWILFQLNAQSVPDFRTDLLPMDSVSPSLNIAWQCLEGAEMWALSVNLQRDPIPQFGFSDVLQIGFHWDTAKPELPFGADLYFAATEEGLEGQLSLSWNFEKELR